MRNAFAVTVIAVAAITLAQDRTLPVAETAVVPTRIVIDLPPDGGCLLTVSIDGIPNFSPATQPRAFNGARCATVRAAALKAAKLDCGVGDGTQP